MVGFEASEAMTSAPLRLPPALGENVTLKAALCPAASVKGNVGPASLNAAPVALAPEMVTLAFPVLVTVSPRVATLPV